MNSILMLLLWGLNWLTTVEQKLVPVDEGSEIKFRIKNLGFTVTGSFRGIAGTMQFDPAQPQTSSFDVSIDANTINTGINMRDNHLRNEEYLDVKNHPRIKFVSTSVTATDQLNHYIVSGKLTIKNTIKDITIPFTANSENGGFVFMGEFKINRRDYEVGGSSFSLSDNLTVSLKVIAKKAD